MRRIALVVLLLMGLVVGGVAFADGPSGSHERDANGNASNNVTCGSSTASVGTLNLYANAQGSPSSQGVEACDQSGTVQGRIIVSRDQYTSVDGDRDNTEKGRGWIRIDGGGVSGGNTDNGVRCGDDNGALDSTNPGPNDGIDDCG